MNSLPPLDFTADKENKRIHVQREFAADVKDVWSAWTESEILDQWWAPKPWKAETKTMDFAEDGHWLYAMVSPEGVKHWCRVNFGQIKDGKSFETTNFFCDEQGNKNME